MVQQRKRGNFRRPRSGHSGRPKTYKVLCSGCGKEVITQVSPPSDKTLLCTDCFSNAGVTPELSPVRTQE